MQLTLEPNQSKIVTLSPKLSDGSPATLASSPSWLILNGPCDMQIAPDGMSAQFNSLDRPVSRTIVAVSADAGREQIGFIIGVDIVPLQAVTLDPEVL